MRVVHRGALIGAGLCLLSSSLVAQRPSRARTPTTQGNATVRAELATVLLQSGRYDEAAREFRTLLARDPSSCEYRLGLARALAWGDHPRDADRELVQLIARRPGALGLDSLLRVVRDAYDPRAVEAAQWVASDPFYAPYRLALARALVREGMPRLAIAQFDTLLARPLAARMPDRGRILREIADAYIAAGDRAGGAERLRGALALAPSDTALRHALATMLADAHRYDDARAQYDTLLLQASSGGLLLERARTRLALGDRAGGESDLQASVGVQPSAGAYLLLGDLFRERGDYRGARSMYVAARRGAPTDVRVAVAGALGQLDREERPAMLAPLVGDDPGWRLSEDAAADNLGVAYSVLGLGRTLPLAAATRLTVGAEWRELAARTLARRTAVLGFGGTVGGWQEVGYGPVLVRLAVEGGAVRHPSAGTFREGRAALSAWLFAWQATVGLETAPAYPSLFSVDALLPVGGGAAVTERDAAFTLGGPLGPLDLGVRWQRSLLSDGNKRLTIESYARYALGANLFAVYSGSGVGFSERSLLYWDPAQFSAQGAGVEYAVRRARGFSFAARVIPTYAWSDESRIAPLPDGGFSRDPITRHTAVQMVAGAEVGYRVHDWEIGSAVSYGRGRAGDYQRFGGTITVRLAP